MNFRELACAHLERYKVDVLGISENGIFRYRGRQIPKTHILPVEFRNRNILEKYRDHFFSSEQARIKFHRYFHHLNSSQALCINLFYPLIAENACELFIEFLGIGSRHSIRPLFEKESDIEDASRRRTSFDFYTRLSRTGSVFVEVKYTEEGFARADNDEEHRTKFREIYLPLLNRKSAFLVSECKDESTFLEHYQLLRNLVHVGDSEFVVLLFPSANTRVAKQAAYARDRLLTDAGREKLKIVYLEEFVSFLETRCANSPLDGYYQDFRNKYLPME